MHQALINHIFREYMGIFMHIYLDDIVMYSNTLNDYIEHVEIDLGILEHEKLYLSEQKLCFLCKDIKILGWTITDQGIQIDSDKVDWILTWKVPINWMLCKGFIGSVGYLTDD